MIPDAGQVRACLDLVTDLQTRGVTSAEARAALARLQASMPAVNLDLVWDVEAVGPTFTYSVLLSKDGWTYSFGAVPHGLLPWPLRGGVDPRAELLLSVDGVSITVAQAIGVLDFVWGTKSIADKLVDMALVARERDRYPREANREEVERAVRQLRDDRGLASDTAYLSWLDRRGISDEQLRRLVEGVLVDRQVERSIVGDRADEEIRERPEQYARARVAWLPIREDQREHAGRLVGQGRDILEITEALGEGTLSRSIELRYMYRYECPAVFEAEPGTMLVAGDAAAACVVKLLSREQTPPAQALRNRAVKRLIAERLRERRARATIEWHWGPTEVPGTTYSAESR